MLGFVLGLVLVMCFWGKVDAIEIKPTEDIDGAVLENINLHLKDLVAPASCNISQRLNRRVENAIAAAVEGAGVYQYEIVSLTPLEDPEQGECQIWSLEIRLANPVALAQVDIVLSGGGQSDPLILSSVNRFPLNTGDTINHQAYERGKAAMLSAATLAGYFDAEWQQQQLVINRAENTGQINLHLQTGERYLFGELLNSLNEDDEALIYSLMPFTPGDPYHSDLLGRYNQRLKRSGYFEHVLVRPVVSAAQQNRVPLEIIFKFKPKNQYSVGGGFSSDTGPRGRASWKRSRLNASGHSIETELFVSIPEQSLGLRYRMPLANPAQNFFSFQAGLKVTNDNDTRSDNQSLSVKRHWLNTQADWQTIAHLRLERESFTQGNQASQTTTMLLPGGTMSRFRSDGELYPMWGDRQLFTFEAGSEDLLSEIDVAKAFVQSRWLREYGQLTKLSKLRWFARLELGAVATNDFAQLPSSLRFFAGGDQSVRGFAYQSLGPRDDSNQLLGGKYLYSASGEVSFAVAESWRLAAFIDAGNAGNSLFDDLATGIGAGVHWLTPVGPVRVYVARGNSDFEKTWRLHFALGAAL